MTVAGNQEVLSGPALGKSPASYDEFLKLVHTEDRERVRQDIERCLAAREDYRQEYRVVWPDGAKRWIESRARVECDSDGRPVRMAGVVRDISDTKEGAEQQQRFRALFDAARDAVFVADDDRRYVEVNAAAGELLRLRPEDLVGRRVEEFVLDVRGTDVDSSWEHFRTAGVQTGECRLRRGDGTECYAEYSATTSFLPGLHLSILRDVTERKLAADASAQLASELATSNADLQQFAYVSSHDLQEPLRGIVSFGQLLHKRYKGQLDEEADRVLDYIVSSAYRMQSLIGSLLAYSRSVSAGATPFPPVPLEAALHLATVNLQTAMEQSGAIVSHDPLPTVAADQVQLVQVFQNLLSNAIKYRRPDEPPRIHVSAEERERDVLVSVRDNGIGIQPEYTQRIFGVFKRLHGTEIPGDGIGLAICKRIVEKHGGEIWVNSEDGQGSTFSFTIARREGASKPRS
jgi:PAS domain S-box-containing protein